MIFRLFCAVFTLNLIRNVSGDGLTETYNWKKIEFEHDSHSGNDSYIPYNNVPMGVTHYKGRVFVTVTRFRPGVPSTLNYIDYDDNYVTREKSPKLKAYPSLEMNRLTSKCRHLVSVYRTRVDKYGRLWLADTGMLEYPNNNTQIQRPAIWVINLHTDRVERIFDVPESIAIDGEGFGSITIDTDLGKKNTFAYIPDWSKNRLHVYSYKLNKMWSFQHNYFHFDPVGGDITVDDKSFRRSSGIISIALGPRNWDRTGSRDAYFHAIASNNEFVVNNRVLQNERNALRSDHGSDFKLVGSRGKRMQSTSHAYDERTGVMFFNQIQLDGVGCWRLGTPLETNYGTVAQSSRMVYPNDLSIDENGVLWVLTNRFPVYTFSKSEENRFNFHVYRRNVRNAISSTLCA